uniref:Thioredoxin domain-containing protein n=1 Tax=Takifugu rubripes TaxID=31033 RepID=A0A674P139_TAKRU
RIQWIHWTSRDFADSKYLFHHAQFTSEVLPDSFKRPYLIKVTSEWCFTCVHIEPVWKEVVQELEPLGESTRKRLSVGPKMDRTPNAHLFMLI